MTTATVTSNGITNRDDPKRQQRRIVAYHEAGHAVASIAFGGDLISFSIGARPERRRFNGHSVATPIPTGSIPGVRMRMTVLAAGPEAERFEKPTAGLIRDSDRASMIELARKIHGMAATRAMIRAEIERARLAARHLLNIYREDVHQLAEMMLSNHSVLESVAPMTDSDIDELIAGNVAGTNTIHEQEHEL